eukprot:scaffold33528_cov84-Skeletonema_dohrnii-CCMP3373.AAC.3
MRLVKCSSVIVGSLLVVEIGDCRAERAGRGPTAPNTQQAHNGRGGGCRAINPTRRGRAFNWMRTN